MARLSMGLVVFVVLFLLSAVSIEAADSEPFPNKVKCTDTKYPRCNGRSLYCLPDCPLTCTMDCRTCRSVCPNTPPPPPRRRRRSPPPPPPSPPPPPPPPPSPLPISPPTATPPPPLSDQNGSARSRCNKNKYPDCYRVSFPCPSSCRSQCQVDCATCRPVCSCDRPGAVCQDPRFIGGDGNTFYFHGKKDRNFCIVSDSNLHINAHFIGRRNTDMKRDFTWVQSLGVLFDTHRIFIGAKKTSTWDDSTDHLALTLDGESIYLPEVVGGKWASSSSSPTIYFKRTEETNSVKIEVENNFMIKATVVPITEKESLIHKYGVTSENCFAHLDLSFKFYSLSGEVSGVLGQTYGANYKSRAKMEVAMPVLGGEREFASSGLFSTDCAASRFIGQFTAQNSSISESFEDLGLSCATEENGRGVVCKR